MKLFFYMMTLVTSCMAVTTPKVPAPLAYGPTPTLNQQRWHEMEYYGLVCYGLNTYTGQEWGYGDKDPGLFNPKNLDTDQWARVAKASGMSGLVLVAKHHDGFCLWPSKTTDYTVAATPWKDGKGDVLGDLAKSCKKYGLKLGVYISPWDRNHAEYGKPAYVKAYHEQWRETLKYSDDIFETWFDGANGGTGYYGGARESRKIQKGYYNFPAIFKLIKEKQPKSVLFGYVEDVTTDVIRWGGTEQGTGSATNWCRYDDVTSTDWNVARTGVKDGKYWMPVEGNTTILYPKKWYYNESSNPRTLTNFVDLYYSTIGQNATFILGLSIGPDGTIPDRDVKSMLAQKKQLDREFAVNLASDAKITASNFRGNDSFYGPDKVNDKTTQTYWSTKDGVKKAMLTIDFNKEVSFNRLLLQEYIALGQRIHKFTLEVEQNGNWRQVSAGTTIGYKRIIRFETAKGSKARVTFETDAPALTISNLEIYNAPAILSEPKITQDKNGMVSITNALQNSIYYSINEGEYQKYSKPFIFKKGGKIDAYALDPITKDKTDVATERLTLSKGLWKITGCSFPNEGTGSVERLIDGDNTTMWHTHGAKGKKPAPHWVTVDLGESTDISGFTCMPRHDGTAVGLVDQYEFYISNDGKSWGKPVVQGEFSNIRNNPNNQVILLKKPTKTRYVKFVAKRAVEGGCVAICELGVVIN